jgi:hypothetical protein
LSGIYVSINHTGALRASPLSIGELKIIVDETAMKTTFGTWEKPINLFNMAAVPLPFVLKLPHELRPAAIGDRLSQLMVFDHPFHIQVFNGDVLVLLNQLTTELVKKVLPLVGYLFVKPGNLQPGLVSALRTFLFPAQRALQLNQLLLRLSEVFGRTEPAPVTGNSKVLKSQIKTSVATLIGWVFNLPFHLDRGEIFTALGSRYGNIFHNAFYWAVKDDLDPTDLGEIDRLTIKLKALRESTGLLTVFLFEGWKVGLLVKKVVVGGIQVSKGLLKCLGLSLVKPNVIRLLFEFCQSQGGIVVGETLACLGIVVDSLAKKVVVSEATAAELFGQLNLLLSIRVKTELVGRLDKHTYSYTLIVVNQ